MEEQKYEFVEDVIKKKPSIIKRILKKAMSLLSLALVLSIGIGVIIFLLRDSLKEILFDKVENGNGSMINVELEDSSDGVDEIDVISLEEEVNKSIVTIAVSNKDNASMDVLCTGVIVAMDDNIYILAPYNKVRNKDNMVVEFMDGTMADAIVWNREVSIGLAAVKVTKSEVKKDTLSHIRYAVLGNENSVNRGYGAVYAGNAIEDDLLFYTGNVAGNGNVSPIYDLSCRTIYTDIMMANVKDGFVFDYYGNLVGIVLSQFNDDTLGCISAVAVYDVYDIIYGMLNKMTLAYIGISGQSVDYDIKKYISQDMPEGLYISMVDNTSPAYDSGIMAGDVLTEINDVDIDNMDDLKKLANSKKPGDTVSLVLQRKMGENYKQVKIELTLGERK
jgi:S1-C subfamily serine protease